MDLTWYEIDFNWYGIRMLQLLGLARGIRLISQEQINAAKQQRRSKPELRELQEAA